MTIDGDFENASLGQVAKIAGNWYHIGLRPDTWYWTHFRVRGCKNKEEDSRNFWRTSFK